MIKESLSKTLRYRWFIFWTLAVQYLLVYFHRVAPAVVASDLIKSFQVSGAFLGMLASAYFYSYSLMQIPVGMLSDRWGAKRVILLFGVIASCGSIMFGLSNNFGIALFSRILVGLGVSAIFIGTMKILAHWFRAVEYARISGVLMSVGGAGWLFATTPLALSSHIFGWRASFIAIGFVSVLMTLISWKVIWDTPEKKGLPDITNVIEPSNNNFSSNHHLFKGLRIILKERHFWAVAIWFTFRGGALFGFYGLWAGPYLMDVYRLTQYETGNILSMIAFAMIFISPVLGHLSDKTLSSRKKILVGSSIVNVFCWIILLLWFDNLSSMGLYILFFFMGITISSVGTIAIITTKEFFPPEIAATSMGTMNIFPFIGGLIFQPLLGYVLDRIGKVGNTYHPLGYKMIIWFLLIGSIFSLVSILFAKETMKKLK